MGFWTCLNITVLRSDFWCDVLLKPPPPIPRQNNDRCTIVYQWPITATWWQRPAFACARYGNTTLCDCMRMWFLFEHPYNTSILLMKTKSAMVLIAVPDLSSRACVLVWSTYGQGIRGHGFETHWAMVGLHTLVKSLVIVYLINLQVAIGNRSITYFLFLHNLYWTKVHILCFYVWT